MKLSVVSVLLVALLLTACGAPMAQVPAAAGSAEQSAGKTAAPEPSASAKDAGEKISKDEAVEIALKHAGFQAEQVKYLRAEYEIDDGVPQYEVQFHQGSWEYDYEINARTGEIMSYDRDD